MTSLEMSGQPMSSYRMPPRKMGVIRMQLTNVLKQFGRCVTRKKDYQKLEEKRNTLERLIEEEINRAFRLGFKEGCESVNPCVREETPLERVLNGTR